MLKNRNDPSSKRTNFVYIMKTISSYVLFIWYTFKTLYNLIITISVVEISSAT